MSYRKFTLSSFSKDFSITISSAEIFPQPIALVEPSSRLKADIDEGVKLPLGTEKAKSENLIAPILREIRRRNDDSFTIFSGYNLSIDRKRKLTGYCDFVLTMQPMPFELQNPIFCVVEAKDEDIESGLGQCAAEMYAARIFNEEHQNPTAILHGCVTSAYDWLFLRLEGNSLRIDKRRYALANLPELLGALQSVIDFYQ
ncbi:MAG: hypothetical protein MUF71_17830 [Candidatus Kapabacteria bacterium]|jgi:hypothetical protein|nr:hypothetical protein [Candidatus Kapabacteria bacterium]